MKNGEASHQVRFQHGRGNNIHLNQDEDMEGTDTLAGRADAPPREEEEEEEEEEEKDEEDEEEEEEEEEECPVGKLH